MTPGDLVRVGNSFGEDLSYLVRSKVGNLDSQDFTVDTGDLGVVLSEPVLHKEGWPSFVRIVFDSGKTGYINANLLEVI
jgi:uncharacterized membrane protein affecting hemolysin expression